MLSWIEHPTFRNLPRNPFQTDFADYADSAYSETDERTYWGLLVRALYRAEILDIQLNNVLGRSNTTPQLTNAGDANTWRGMITRYKCLFDSMNNRESEIPTLNQAPDASENSMSHLSPQFNIGPSIQSGSVDQSGQIDLSDSQIDLNSNIEINYPKTSASWDDTCNDGENGESFATGSGNNDTGNGNYLSAQEENPASYTNDRSSGNPEMDIPFYFEKNEYE